MHSAASYLGTLRAHWLLLLVLMALGPALGSLGSRFMATEYTANRLLVVIAEGGTSLTDLAQGGDLAVSRAQALAYVGNAPATRYDAMAQLGVGISRADEFSISASVPANTTYIELQTKGPTAESALGLARQAAIKLVAANGDWSTRIASSSRANVGVRDITPVGMQQQARPGGSPRWLLPLAGAVLLPLLALLGFVLRNALHPRVGESTGLENVLPFPALGFIPGAGGERPQDVRTAPAHSAIATRYGLMPSGIRGRVVALTPVDGSSDAGPALALGRALAQMGRRVTVVDSDMREPTLDPTTPGGLARALSDGGDPTADLQPSGDPGMLLLPTPERTDGPRLLLSPEARGVFKNLRETADFVLVSGSSPFTGPEAAAIADLSDEVLLIADHDTLVDRVLAASQAFRQGSVAGMLIRETGRVRWAGAVRSAVERVRGQG